MQTDWDQWVHWYWSYTPAVVCEVSDDIITTITINPLRNVLVFGTWKFETCWCLCCVHITRKHTWFHHSWCVAQHHSRVFAPVSFAWREQMWTGSLFAPSWLSEQITCLYWCVRCRQSSFDWWTSRLTTCSSVRLLLLLGWLITIWTTNKQMSTWCLSQGSPLTSVLSHTWWSCTVDTGIWVATGGNEVRKTCWTVPDGINKDN